MCVGQSPGPSREASESLDYRATGRHRQPVWPCVPPGEVQVTFFCAGIWVRRPWLHSWNFVCAVWHIHEPLPAFVEE